MWIGFGYVDGFNRGQYLFFFFRRVLVFQRRKRMNSVGRGPLGLNRFGREKTEPNRTEINRFEPVFGSVRFKKLKKNKNRFGCLFWFKTGPNRKCSALSKTKI
jgi:hypothetical protein